MNKAENAADVMLRRLQQDYEYYAPRVLRVKTKAGQIVSFKFNAMQRKIHAMLEGQLQATGMVRALLLKMRQGGGSTYIGGRYYHKTSMRSGKKAFILTHEQAATDNLFDITERFYDNDTVIHPNAGAANEKSLYFDRLDSGYAVATAGTKAVGRSSTVQLFHGSEVAFWPNAKDHLAGLGQTVPEEPGTEIILETTGNGFETFHEMWQLAESGASKYLPIFVPWFMAEDYAKPVPPGFKFSQEELEVQELHKLTPEQMYWRHRKIIDDFLGDETLFQQEYPATANEAFVNFTESYLRTIDVLRARKTQIDTPYGALMLGVDPSRFGDDSTALVWRQGRKAGRYERLYSQNTMEIANRIARYIREDNLAKVFIDIVGLGVGIYDRLIEQGYGGIVVGVGAGNEASDKNKWFNKKSEMWFLMNEWIKDGPVQIPDTDEFQSDLQAPKYSYNSNQQLIIESKESMRKRQVRSPDLADALALTFAFPVHLAESMDHGRSAPRRVERANVSWRAR